MLKGARPLKCEGALKGAGPPRHVTAGRRGQQAARLRVPPQAAQAVSVDNFRKAAVENIGVKGHGKQIVPSVWKRPSAPRHGGKRSVVPDNVPGLIRAKVQFIHRRRAGPLNVPVLIEGKTPAHGVDQPADIFLVFDQPDLPEGADTILKKFIPLPTLPADKRSVFLLQLFQSDSVHSFLRIANVFLYSNGRVGKCQIRRGGMVQILLLHCGRCPALSACLASQTWLVKIPPKT